MTNVIRVLVTESQPAPNARIASISATVGGTTVLSATLTRTYDPDAYFLEPGVMSAEALRLDVVAAVNAEMTKLHERWEVRP